MLLWANTYRVIYIWVREHAVTLGVWESVLCLWKQSPDTSGVHERGASCCVPAVTSWGGLSSPWSWYHLTTGIFFSPPKEEATWVMGAAHVSGMLLVNHFTPTGTELQADSSQGHLLAVCRTKLSADQVGAQVYRLREGTPLSPATASRVRPLGTNTQRVQVMDPEGVCCFGTCSGTVLFRDI